MQKLAEVKGFHSIDFPSEWGATDSHHYSVGKRSSFHSIGFPSEWGADIAAFATADRTSFHSIGFPSEWGASAQYQWSSRLGNGFVSIQLVSPASGESLKLVLKPPITCCFHSIGFPSEWGGQEVEESESPSYPGFPFNWFPQRVGRHHDRLLRDRASVFSLKFPFNWFPQRVGRKIFALVVLPLVRYSFHSIGFPSE